MTAEVWATDTIQADLPPMVEFKAKADKIIKARWGIEVEHVRAKRSYQDIFYMVCHGEKPRIAGKIYGWPFQRGPWCNSRLKQQILSSVSKGTIQYIDTVAGEIVDRYNGKYQGSKDVVASRIWREMQD